ncbi:MAG: hypothetical protein M3306_10095 [Actinomycetota bacterium]|nr:hypothetical protein [Actinomycetota bacterium]
MLDGGRHGVSTAIAFEDKVYVVDLGVGAFGRLQQSGLAPHTGLGSALAWVRGIFFTHLHSDHTVDWPTTYTIGSVVVSGDTCVSQNLIDLARGADVLVHEVIDPEFVEPAGVGTLALSHLVPGNNPSARWRKAQRGFSGDLVVGEDLMVIPVGRARWNN